MADYLELEFASSDKRERFCGTQNGNFRHVILITLLVQLSPNFGSGPTKLRVVSNGDVEGKGFALRYQVVPRIGREVIKVSPRLK